MLGSRRTGAPACPHLLWQYRTGQAGVPVLPSKQTRYRTSAAYDPRPLTRGNFRPPSYSACAAARHSRAQKRKLILMLLHRTAISLAAYRIARIVPRDSIGEDGREGEEDES